MLLYFFKNFIQFLTVGVQRGVAFIFSCSPDKQSCLILGFSDLKSNMLSWIGYKMFGHYLQMWEYCKHLPIEQFQLWYKLGVKKVLP